MALSTMDTKWFPHLGIFLAILLVGLRSQTGLLQQKQDFTTLRRCLAHLAECGDSFSAHYPFTKQAKHTWDSICHSSAPPYIHYNPLYGPSVSAIPIMSTGCAMLRTNSKALLQLCLELVDLRFQLPDVFHQLPVLGVEDFVNVGRNIGDAKFLPSPAWQ